MVEVPGDEKRLRTGAALLHLQGARRVTKNRLPIVRFGGTADPKTLLSIAFTFLSLSVFHRRRTLLGFKPSAARTAHLFRSATVSTRTFREISVLRPIGHASFRLDRSG